MAISSQVNKLSSELILFERIKTEYGVVLAYKIENYDDLLGKYDKKEVQRAAIDLTLKSELKAFSLSRAKSGAPELISDDFSEISLSHSSGLIAIYLSNEPVGIDIEIPREIPPSGTSYFLNSEDSSDWNNDELLAIWGAKEALFKKQKGEIVDLRVEATVLEIEDVVKVEFKGEVFLFKLAQTQNYTLVYG